MRKYNAIHYFSIGTAITIRTIEMESQEQIAHRLRKLLIARGYTKKQANRMLCKAIYETNAFMPAMQK